MSTQHRKRAGCLCIPFLLTHHCLFLLLAVGEGGACDVFLFFSPSTRPHPLFCFWLHPITSCALTFFFPFLSLLHLSFSFSPFFIAPFFFLCVCWSECSVPLFLSLSPLSLLHLPPFTLHHFTQPSATAQASVCAHQPLLTRWSTARARPSSDECGSQGPARRAPRRRPRARSR